jgi:hypothetical protein
VVVNHTGEAKVTELEGAVFVEENVGRFQVPEGGRAGGREGGREGGRKKRVGQVSDKRCGG